MFLPGISYFLQIFSENVSICSPTLERRSISSSVQSWGYVQSSLWGLKGSPPWDAEVGEGLPEALYL